MFSSLKQPERLMLSFSFYEEFLEFRYEEMAANMLAQ